MDLCLYSTNPWIKFHIQKEYFGDVHYVWCSPCFNSESAPTYSIEYMIPGTSNPAQIFRDLNAFVATPDNHHPFVQGQKNRIVKRVRSCLKEGEITEQASTEILALLNSGSPQLWRPFVYVIPRTKIVESRIHPVAPKKRASLGPEFIIEDLRGNEFDIVEFDTRS